MLEFDNDLHEFRCNFCKKAALYSNDEITQYKTYRRTKGGLKVSYYYKFKCKYCGRGVSHIGRIKEKIDAEVEPKSFEVNDIIWYIHNEMNIDISDVLALLSIKFSGKYFEHKADFIKEMNKAYKEVTLSGKEERKD